MYILIYEKYTNTYFNNKLLKVHDCKFMTMYLQYEVWNYGTKKIMLCAYPLSF